MAEETRAQGQALERLALSYDRLRVDREGANLAVCAERLSNGTSYAVAHFRITPDGSTKTNQRRMP